MRIPAFLLLVPWSFAQLQERQVLQPSQTKPAAPRSDVGGFVLKAGTRIPLTVLNSVSSKNAAPGDRIYLQTLIPVAVDRRIVIPAGSYVYGSITQSARPGRVKGRGELYLRFDSLMLPNGVSIDLLGRIGGLDGDNPGKLSRDEGKLTSDGNVANDAIVAGGAAVTGTAMGHWIGGRGRNAGIGAGAGAAAGLGAVLLTRGPDAVLHRGSTVEMLLSGDLRLKEDELDFSASPGNHKRIPN